jgi:hypothetical protein
MSDAKLRNLERRWKETGTVEAEAAYLGECVRAGTISITPVIALACTGDDRAQAIADRVVPDWRETLATINPGRGIGPFELGTRPSECVIALTAFGIERRRSCYVIHSRLLDFFVDTATDRIDQILAKAGFPGPLLGEIRVGARFATLERVVGPIHEDDQDALKSDRYPGVGFETNGLFDDAEVWAIYVRAVGDPSGSST